MHRFFLVGRPDLFDKNVVLGLFLYQDDAHEIDIEFAKWGIEDLDANAQYAVQPWDREGNREPFLLSLNGTYSTHYIDWNTSQVQFKSIHGHYDEPPTVHHLIREWPYSGEDIPAREGCLPVHINLWLFRGAAPSDGQQAEIIVRSAELPALPPKMLYLPLILWIEP